MPLTAPAGAAPPAALSPAAAPVAQDGDPIILLDSAPRPRAAGRRAIQPGADPFAPPPEGDVAPLLAGDLDRSVSSRPSHAARLMPEPERFAPEPSPPPALRTRERPVPPPEAIAPARRQAPAGATRERMPAPPELEPTRKKHSWLLWACVLVVLAVAVRFA